MGEYLQVFRARFPQQSVAALLEIRPAAIAEAQRLCPELLQVLSIKPPPHPWMVPARGEADQVDRRDGVRHAAISHPPIVSRA